MSASNFCSDVDAGPSGRPLAAGRGAPRWAAALLALLPGWALAIEPLNDSGLGACINPANGLPVASCAGTGQDGEFGRDVTKAKASDGDLGFSFVKVCNDGQLAKRNAGAGECSTAAVRGAGPLDWGCTLDKVTGITWYLKATNNGPDDYRRTHNYTNAQGYAGGLNPVATCGFDDWRLPTRVELQSIVNFGISANTPLVDADWLGAFTTGDHWTSTLLASDPANQAWRVNFGDGGAQPVTRATLLAVRPMRADSRWRRSGNEVTDGQTGLIWRRCPLGQSLVAGLCDGQINIADWGEAIALAQAEATSTGLAWRLPSIKELASLVDTGRTAPALDVVAFPVGPTLSAWSATHQEEVSGSRNDALMVNFGTGTVLVDQRITNRAVLLVRDP